METLKKRVSAYCKRKNISIYKFEKESGLSNGYFNQVKTRPSDDKLMSIHRAFPDLNIDWLSTGEGEMLNVKYIEAHASNHSNVQIAKNIGNDNVQLAVLKSENEMLRAQLEDRDKQIEFLKSLINK